MKKILCIITAIICLFSFPLLCFAHSGRTDSSGGHHDRSTGEYHYHHGYSAHQHPNGICPYENNNTNISSVSLNTDSLIIYILLSIGEVWGIHHLLYELEIDFDPKKFKSYAAYRMTRIILFILIFVVLFLLNCHFDILD